MFSYGKQIKIQVFGQSHSEAIGVVIDGFPAGVKIEEERLAAFMERRAPGRNAFSTTRSEADQVKFVSGVHEEVTTGAPICAMIFNTNKRSGDYDQLRDIPRPSHADYAAYSKYGSFRDHRGGGEFSGRLTAPLCIAGFLCMEVLREKGIHIGAHIASVGEVSDDRFDAVHLSEQELNSVVTKDFPVINDQKGLAMQEIILDAKSHADSVGGVIECGIIGLPAGVGDSSFGGIEGRIALAIFGIPAVKGIEFGSGFAGSQMRGSQNNDPIQTDGEHVYTTTNHAGGILGGISNGMPIVFRAAFKPTPSIGLPQESISLSASKNVQLQIVGRHDPCIVQRAVPVTEAVAAIAILDTLLD